MAKKEKNLEVKEKTTKKKETKKDVRQTSNLSKGGTVHQKLNFTRTVKEPWRNEISNSKVVTRNRDSVIWRESVVGSMKFSEE